MHRLPKGWATSQAYCAFLNFDGCCIFRIFFGTIPKRLPSKQIMTTKTKTLIIGIAGILLVLPVVAQTLEVVSIKPRGPVDVVVVDSIQKPSEN